MKLGVHVFTSLPSSSPNSLSLTPSLTPSLLPSAQVQGVIAIATVRVVTLPLPAFAPLVTTPFQL